VGPLPIGDPDRLYAPGLRVWGFARALLAAGCEVDILEVKFGQGAQAGADAQLHRLSHASEPPEGWRADASMPGAGPTVAVWSRALPAAAPAALVAAQLAQSTYDAVVATTDVMNSACAQACGGLPLWCDCNGDPMAECQGIAHLFASDEGLAGQWDMLLPALLRADRFSACSRAQRLALIGQIGACGRLGFRNDGHPLVLACPPATVMADFDPRAGGGPRETLVPKDAFVVLWTGGYNTWADAETLARGLFAAMERDGRIHYVSTGGAIVGHDEQTFARFQALVDASPFAPRFHFAGWVPTGQVAAFYLQADVAVNCDRLTLEGELGWRNRIEEWVCAGLPVVTTDLCELTSDLAGEGLIATFAPGDWAGLRDRLLEAAARPRDEARQRAERAREFMRIHFAPEKIYGALTAWARAPRRAPDLAGGGGQRLDGVPFAFPANALALRRAEEWVRARAQAQAPAHPLRTRGPLRRALGRLRRWAASRP
jgi:glycosyltransferase involved in cell wall biosynthesis